MGQTATQELAITLKPINAEGTRVARLVDLLAAVNGIEISSIVFDIEDKSEQQKEARDNAYADAKQKAEDYAEFSGNKVGRALIISDFIRVESAPIQESFRAAALSIADSIPTNIQIGELDVGYDVTVTFSL